MKTRRAKTMEGLTPLDPRTEACSKSGGGFLSCTRWVCARRRPNVEDNGGEVSAGSLPPSNLSPHSCRAAVAPNRSVNAMKDLQHVRQQERDHPQPTEPLRMLACTLAQAASPHSGDGSTYQWGKSITRTMYSDLKEEFNMTQARLVLDFQLVDDSFECRGHLQRR